MVRFATLDRPLWPRVVRALAALGFNAIDVPVVWREHETPDGQWDFTTERRALDAFLQAVADEGLKAIVRLGPWPTSDVTSLGLPDRVLYDRACQARTRRQNPVMVLDLPRLTPLPSVASRAYRAEAARWVSAASEVIAPRVTSGQVVRVVIGHGPPAVLRDDPFEFDHHPDARVENTQPVTPPHEPTGAALAEVDREARHAREFLDALANAARAAGVTDGVLTYAVPGGALISPLALALSRDRRVALAAPPSRAGTLGIWRAMRHASALPVAPHIDLRAGNPPFEPPTRAVPTLHAARVALAAGARDITVQMGCSGDRWIGALLDEHGHAHAIAARWSSLLQWADAIPTGRDRAARIVTTPDTARALRASTAAHPLPLGLLAWVGFTPDEIAPEEVSAATSHDRIEEELARRALPVLRTERRAADDPAYAGGDATEFIARASDALDAYAPRIEPLGSALVRAVETDGALTLVVVSRIAEPVRVTPPDGALWHDDRGLMLDTRTLTGGDALVMRRDRVTAGGAA